MPFWMAYFGNSLVTIAVALLYRYADFVTLLGGSEFHLGWIVGVGMIGSLLMRFALGSGIDRYGPARVWIGSLAAFALVCFAHLGISSYQGPAIYLLRIALFSAIAGIFGSSITFISGRVSIARMAELVGMLGTSGFMGMVIGAQWGDLLCGTQTVQRWQIDRLFVVCGLLAIGAMWFAWLATRGLPAPSRRRRRAPLLALVRRYQPGTVLVVGIAVGAALALPATFLRTYAAELDIARIGLFFGVYAPTAIITRVATRRMPEQIGLVPMTLIGMAVLSAGDLLFLPVGAEWQFVFPAVGFGISHAILFPTITATGSGAFPVRYRGLGTMVILAAFDAGQLVGAPAAGAIVHFSGLVGLPRYPTLFVTMAVILGAVGIGYALTSRRVAGPLSRRVESRGGRLSWVRSGGGRVEGEGSGVVFRVGR
ncbi:MAG: hypothetical protein HUU20_19485 [Pirellulales bacterium]|nr:hypothetical protein [Pirellulales bacterium]